VDLEREQGCRPVARSRPRRHGVDDGEIDQFLGGLLVGEVSFGFDRFAQLPVERLNGIRIRYDIRARAGLAVGPGF
jgi:hypothetical protein